MAVPILPDRTDDVIICDTFRNFERLFNLSMEPSGDRFLDKHSHTGEMFHDLHFDVPSGLHGPSEHRGTANNDRTRLLTRGHVLNKLIQGFVDTSILIGRNNKGLAFLLEDSAGAVDCGIDQGDYLETRTKFTGVV